MKSRIKAVCIVSVLAFALTACGGGGGSSEPAAAEPTPVVADQPVVPQQPQDPQNPQDPHVPQDPQVPQDTQEPETPPLPVANQTGWSFYGIESRKPLELLKTLMCSQLAAMHEELAPQSNEACDTRFPGLQSGNEESLPIFAEVAPGTELVKREGCTFVTAEQALACSWTYVWAHPESSTGYFKAYIALPFMASFGLEVENCAADKPHHFALELARAPAQSGGPVVKDLDVPFGCVGWADTADFFRHVEAGMEVDEYSPD